jgi:hypothetical protein
LKFLRSELDDRQKQAQQGASAIGRFALRTFGHFAHITRLFRDVRPLPGSDRHVSCIASAIRPGDEKVSGNDPP